MTSTGCSPYSVRATRIGSTKEMDFNISLGVYSVSSFLRVGKTHLIVYQNIKLEEGQASVVLGKAHLIFYQTYKRARPVSSYVARVAGLQFNHPFDDGLRIGACSHLLSMET